MGGKTYKILIIDDEPMIRENLSGFFEDEGDDVHTAGSGEEALEIIEKAKDEGSPFHAAVVDMKMPGIDGDVCIIRAMEIQSNLVCLIHTGSGEFRIEEPLSELGLTGEHVFYKPIEDMAILREKITSLLGPKP